MKNNAEIKNDVDLQNQKLTTPDELKESNATNEEEVIQNEVKEDVVQPEAEVEVVDSADEVFLIVKNQSGSEEIKHMLVEGKEIVIGSGSECDVLVFDEYVSTKHFVVKLDNGKIMIRDLNSTNGLYVKIDNSLEIKKGQSLLAGVSLFSFEEKKSDQSLS